MDQCKVFCFDRRSFRVFGVSRDNSPNRIEGDYEVVVSVIAEMSSSQHLNHRVGAR